MARFYKTARTSFVAYVALSTLAISQICAAAQKLVAVPTEAVGSAGSLDLSQSAPPSKLHLTFALKSAGQQDIDDYVASLTDVESPNYHKWLTSQEFGEKFGASLSDINAVTSYLLTHDFSAINVWPNRLFVSAQIPAADAQNLFNVHIRNYARSQAEVARGFSTSYYAPDSSPVVDRGVADRLEGIFGLSNAGQRRPYYTRPLARTDSIPTNGLSPSDLAMVYDGAALHSNGCEGAGETIAIFSPTTYNSSDVNAFLSANNITGANISIVNVNGGATDNSSQEEACIDIESVVGQAPASTIKVYEGPNDGSLDIFNQMEEDDPSIVTESYGTDENSVTASFAASYEMLRKEMAAEGISIIVASGDNGAYDSINQATVTTSVDATSAYVTSIGGTELPSLTDDFWNGEIAWTYNDGSLGSNSGSGGGLSIYYPEPSWQTGPGVSNSSSNGMRQIPDVSSLASTPYYSIYALGQFTSYGGTSCACQFFGGTLALIEEMLGGRLGNIDPQLYECGTSDPSIYHDITSGNNGLYYCTPNWDFVTGWGSIDFAKLAYVMLGGSESTTPIHTFSSGLQMFSLPYSFTSGATAAEVLNGLAAPSGYPAYDIAAYRTTESQYVISPTAPAALPVPGSGYWARFAESRGGTLTAIGSPIASPTFSVTLNPGWNIVGDPYTSSVPIEALVVATSAGAVSFDSAVNSGLLEPYFYDYAGGLYNAHGSGDTLNSYDGYWIYALVDCTLTFTSP